MARWELYLLRQGRVDGRTWVVQHRVCPISTLPMGGGGRPLVDRRTENMKKLSFLVWGMWSVNIIVSIKNVSWFSSV